MNHEYETSAIQFALFALSCTLSFVIFGLENKDRPKTQYIMLDEDEVSNSAKVLYCDYFINISFQLDSPEEKTNIFGRLTFSWMTPLMRLGYQKPLVMDDLW